MTMYETLRALVYFKPSKKQLRVKFIDVVKAMEQINNKKYNLFDYKKIENTLRFFNIYTAEHISSEAKMLLNDSTLINEIPIEEYEFRAGMIEELEDGDLCVTYTMHGDPRVIYDWKDFQSTLREKIREKVVTNYVNTEY